MKFIKTSILVIYILICLSNALKVPEGKCCPCANSNPRFKETEKNTGCCGCGKPMTMISPIEANTRTARTINDFGTHVVTSESRERIDTFEIPKQIGDSFFEVPHKAIAEFEQKPLMLHVN